MAPRDPLEVQCGGARASSVGNLLDAKRATVTDPRHAFRYRAAREAALRRTVLALAAEEARNRDAGLALEAYWALAEAEHSLPELLAAIDAADAALGDQATLRGRGLDVPLDEAPLRLQKLTLDDARITAAAGCDSLSTTVRQLAGLPPGVVRTMHPVTGRAAVDEPLDVEVLVAEGLDRRPELRMLRAVLSNLDGDTAAVGMMVLSLANPALGDDQATDRWCGGWVAALLHHGERHMATAHIRRQLQQLLHDRHQAVEAEIRQATRLATAAADRVIAAETKSTVTAQSAADKRARQPLGDSDAFAVHLADVEAAAARRGVIERLAAWERARVKVWQAQGVLAAGCCRER